MTAPPIFGRYFGLARLAQQAARLGASAWGNSNEGQGAFSGQGGCSTGGNRSGSSADAAYPGSPGDPSAV